VRELGRLDVLVNDAAEQHTTESISEISPEQLERTFRTNIFAMFFLTKAALPHLGEGSAIVTSPWAVPASRSRSRPATCSWPATTPPGRAGPAPPTAATSSTAEVQPGRSLIWRPDEGANLRDGLIRALTRHVTGA
jgi:NAD(P)-dependent dehydrogenase (short-subunit alcohol dehydrogenase family)